MTEKEMFVLTRVILQSVEEIVKGKSEPGPVSTLKRIRRISAQYEEAKAKSDA